MVVGLAVIEKSFATGVVTTKVTVVVCVAEVPVPVIVSVNIPAVEPEVSVSVELPPAVTLVGLNDALASAGRPLMESDTFCALPDVTAVLMVVVPLDPCATETVVGFALIEESFAAMTKVTMVVWVAEVPVPVIVSENVPGAAVPEFSVSVELPPAVTLVGLNVALAPEGRPVMESVMLCALPDVTAVLMVVVPLEF